MCRARRIQGSCGGGGGGWGIHNQILSVFRDMCRARTMTVFTPHREFVEGRLFIKPDLPLNRIGATTVTHNAAVKNGTSKPPVLNLKSRRKTPGTRFAVIGEGSFEQGVVPLHQESETVLSRANDIIEFPILTEYLFTVGVKRILTLKKPAIAARHPKI